MKGQLARHVIEGEWSGYTSKQQHIVHREVTRSRSLIEWVKETYAISYTDGTSLFLHVRPCKPREKVREVLGYTSLIRDCFYYGVSSVDDLQTARRLQKEVV
jgi:hypothetical protein